MAKFPTVEKSGTSVGTECSVWFRRTSMLFPFNMFFRVLANELGPVQLVVEKMKDLAASRGCRWLCLLFQFPE